MPVVKDRLGAIIANEVLLVGYGRPAAGCSEGPTFKTALLN